MECRIAFRPGQRISRLPAWLQDCWVPRLTAPCQGLARWLKLSPFLPSHLFREAVVAADLWLWLRSPFGGFTVPRGGLRMSRDSVSWGDGASALSASPS